MNWQFCLISLGICSAVVSALICINGYRRNRRDVLPPPQSTVVRHVYHESAYRVGNMSGCK